MPALGQYAPGTYFRPCDVCGSTFKVRPSDVRKAEQRGIQAPRFCSVACQHSTYTGEGNPKWRGGQIIDKDGYVLELAPGHPNANRHGYVRQHRLVVERRLGRYLEPDEVVHHDNETKDDNRDENLVLLPSCGAHRTEHGDWQYGPCAHCGTPVRRSAGMRRRGVRVCCSKRCAMLRRNARARRAAS